MANQACYVQINDGVRRVWYIKRIWELARDLPVKEVPIESIRGLDEVTWFSQENPATVRSVVEHSRRIQNCDTSYPIILTENNCVFDGMHRLARFLLDGQTIVPVVQFPVNPHPDEGPAWESPQAVKKD